MPKLERKGFLSESGRNQLIEILEGRFVQTVAHPAHDCRSTYEETIFAQSEVRDS